MALNVIVIIPFTMLAGCSGDSSITLPPPGWASACSAFYRGSNSGKGGGEHGPGFCSAGFEWPRSTHRAAQKARSPGKSSSRPEQGQFMALCTKAHLVSPQGCSCVFQTKSSPGDVRVKPRLDISFWDRRPRPFPRAAQPPATISSPAVHGPM